MPAKPSSFCEARLLSASQIRLWTTPPYPTSTFFGPQSPGETNAASSSLNDNRSASGSAVQVNLKDLYESADSRSNPWFILATSLKSLAQASFT